VSFEINSKKQKPHPKRPIYKEKTPAPSKEQEKKDNNKNKEK
jgi:hypothetical protein